MLDPKKRRYAVGASEIAAVMGWDQRQTALGVWLQKMGLVEPTVETYRMRRGKLLERLLIEKEYPRITGREAEYADVTQEDPERPHMVVTADGFDKVLNCGIEAKVVARDQAHLWEEGPPPNYFIQCQYSMLFFRWSQWMIIVTIGDDEPEVYIVPRDEDLIQVIDNAAIEFRSRYLLPEVQPPVDGSAATAIYLQRKFPRHKRPDIRLATTQEILMLEKYARVRAEFKSIEAEKKLLENQLREAVGGSEGISWEAGKFTWRKTRDGTWMDWKSMAIALSYNFIKDEEKRRSLEESYLRPKPGERRIYFSHKAIGEIEEEAVA